MAEGAGGMAEGASGEGMRRRWQWRNTTMMASLQERRGRAGSESPVFEKEESESEI